jgi:S-adenosylmethionine hydrolase
VSSGSPASSLITFTTDFGSGWYVGAMKGAALRVNPRAALIDISHGVSGMRVLEGAFALAAGCGPFPDGAVHVAVVDPGVGTARRALVLETDRFRFVGPDNGVLTLAAPPAEVRRAFAIEDPRFFVRDPSPTFHGRDVFAPAAAHLTLGVDPSEMGPEAADLVSLAWPDVLREGRDLQGEVLFADGFGNLVTNIPGDLARGGDAAPEVYVDGRRLGPIERTYGEVPRGEALALVGSHGFLEIAVHGGSAARKLDLGRGSKVQVRRR